MKIGFAQVEITPKVGIELAGYLGERISTKVDSPLYAKALVFKEKNKQYLWLTLDIVAVDYHFYNELKRELEVRLYNFSDIQIIATHTHSAPKGVCETKSLQDLFGEVDVAFLRHLAISSMRAVKNAVMDLDDFTCSVSQKEVQGVAASRHDPYIPLDNVVTTFQFKRKEKEPILLYHYPVHPTVLRADSTVISSDLVGGIAHHLPEFKNQMFLNGASGNVSTRFTRKGSTTREVKRLGKIVATAIKESLTEARDVAMDEIYALHYSYDMKKRKLPPLEVCEAQVQKATKHLEQAIADNLQDPMEIRFLQSIVEGETMFCNLIKHDDGLPNQEIHFAIVVLGPIRFIFMPFEIFSTLASKIDCDNCIVVNYANGYEYYLPDKSAYEMEYYEANMTYYEKGEGEGFINFINDKIHALNKRLDKKHKEAATS